jgi:hypothetical protein
MKPCGLRGSAPPTSRLCIQSVSEGPRDPTVAPRSLGPIAALAYVVCSMVNAKIRKSPEVFVYLLTGSTLINTN